ncbi:polysaccharide lyase family 7 protein [Aquimarina sp. 2201CG14-23]|uniref:polysaccharide lyase family 7 protein n=1 Tax=Aquimarina mycalae TaxID=3040073 RepID=UPI0024782285|nr:polysaccharide lyase family 7 protein [Aquimarina sp. 2201CG14-23]MDH7447785.1 polysaccharide lyase family 7 protein [Aquimarina sp. 2201CG14-23]
MKKSTLSKFCYTIFILFFMYSSSSCTNDLTEELSPEAEEIKDDIDQKLSTGDFTWKNWYLSVPINRGDGKATSIYYKDLEDANFTSSEDDYVWKNSNGSYTFKTKFTGYTTSGQYGTNKGKYCRTELREYWRGNQSTSDNWSMSSGYHKMESKLRVESIGGNKRTFVAQIHGYGGNSPATVKVAWDNGMIKLEYYVKPTSGSNWTSKYIVKKDLGYVGDSIFTIYLEIKSGKLRTKLYCSDRGINTGYKTQYDYKGNGYDYDNYFKTGNYFNWNKDKSATSKVRIYGVKTTHY